MESKKRLMFSLYEDFNYITLKLITILHVFDSYSKGWVDIRKIGVLIEFQKGNVDLLRKTVRGESLDSNDKAKLLEIYTKGKIHETTIRKVLKSLDSKSIIKVETSDRFKCLNVKLLKNKEIIAIVCNERYEKTISEYREMKEIYSRIKTVKYESFLEKAIRGKEVLR